MSYLLMVRDLVSRQMRHAVDLVLLPPYPWLQLPATTGQDTWMQRSRDASWTHQLRWCLWEAIRQPPSAARCSLSTEDCRAAAVSQCL